MRGSSLTRAARAFLLLALLAGMHPLAVPMTAEFVPSALVIAARDCTGCNMMGMGGRLCHMVCTQAPVIAPVVMTEATISGAAVLPSDEIARLGRAIPPSLAPPRFS
jgi:hypothetical protein